MLKVREFSSAVTSPALVLRAEREPLPGILKPGPHQTYRWPGLSIEERVLGPLAPDHLRVKMLLVGLCGTDRHVASADPATGYLLSSAPLEIGPEGRVLGHEGVGRVLEVGAGVRGHRSGALVAFESLLSCRECSACRRGEFNHCRHSALLGLQFDGLFQTVVDVPTRLAHDVSDLGGTPDGLQAAACLEPAGVAYRALQRAALRPGERVLVFGAGPIGLFTAMLARLAFGASSVQVVEPLPLRRELAARWADEDGSEEVDVVVEASADLANIEQVLPRLGPCARVVLLGRGGRPLQLKGVDHLITNGVTLVGSRGHLGACEPVLALYRAGRLPLHEVVTGVVEGLDGLRAELENPIRLEERHAKLLARL